ncbi:MMPL family transporter [Planctomyces sp. SH-PL62]|uniref:MMPL family transporter n=1 Tax=Planctomyces sp. SH-PL62 TaxID=1636152 RepID=UPI00078E1C18|nr:MMPL family transporter [Planctomyces sp. SH-PL62]AMV39348.1 Putative membrane protein YdgH [Planctomyces sp. SH-PL62]
MFPFLARLVQRRSWIVLVLWTAATALLFLYAPRWDEVTKDDDVRFFPRDYPSVVGQDLLERGFPRDASSSQLVFVFDRRSGPLTPQDLAFVEKHAADFYKWSEADPTLGVKKLDTHRSPVIGPRLIGKAQDGPGQAVLTIASLNGTYLSRKTRIAVDNILEYLAQQPPLPEGLERTVTGSAVVGHDMNTAANESIENTTTATIVLVIAILLIVYRSPLLAMVPLVTIAFSVVVSMKAIAALTAIPWITFQVINITRVFVVVVLFGAGTDYCLFLIARYREELARGRSRRDALREAIEQVGGALVASAGTVIIGLGMLYFSSFAKIRYTGPAIALSLTIALLAALTLAPMLLSWLGGAIFWPFRPPHHSPGMSREEESLDEVPMSGFWVWVANLVVRHPIWILVVSLSALLPLAVIGARTTSNYSQLADLAPDRPSVVGASRIRHYFAVGELSPTIAVVENPKLDFRSPEGREKVAEVTARLLAVPGVAEVRSLSQPLGKPPIPEAEMNFLQKMADRALRAAADGRYVSINPVETREPGQAEVPAARSRNHITRFDVVFATDPFSKASLDSLALVNETLNAASRPGGPLQGCTGIGLAGSTSAVNDLMRVTTGDERRMYFLVTFGVFIILVALLRRPGTCLYLILTVVLGYLASLGVTELVFSSIHQGTEPWGGLDWTVGFFLFVILVAVGEDYNILLMARVIEEEAKHGVVEGTRRAVAHTGGIISSCGLIMAGTFGSMLTGSLTSLKELGFSLGLGILLDTFLVRPILVPAFVVVADRLWNDVGPTRAERAREPKPLDPSANGQPAGAEPDKSLVPDAVDSCLGEFYED